MKKLLLLRHGKAEPDAANGDRERALTERGELAAALAAQHIREAVGRPDAVLSSPARRALGTARIACAVLDCLDSLNLDEGLYGADVPALSSAIRDVPNNANALLVVGHNPGLEDLATALSDSSSRPVGMPTGAVAYLELDIASWSDVRRECGRLKSLWSPRSGVA